MSEKMSVVVTRLRMKYLKEVVLNVTIFLLTPVQVTTSLNNNNTHLEGKKKGNQDSFSWEAASD